MLLEAKVQTVNPDVYRILAKRVQKGLTRLRKHKGPKWYTKINLGKLNLADYTMCVVGQVFKNDGNFGAVGELGEDVGDNPQDFGFEIYQNGPGIVWDEKETEIKVFDETTQHYLYGILGDIWVDVIRREKLKNKKK